MSTKALQPSVSKLYDEDFAAWTSHTAHLLRAGRFADLDVEHLAEEVEDMGKSERREVLSRITVKGRGNILPYRPGSRCEP